MTTRRTTALMMAAALVGGGAAPAWSFGRGHKGTSGAQFLKLAPGARPASMGEAFGGVADDVHAVYYNPAGLGHLKRLEAAAMHNSHFQGIRHNFGAIAVPVLSWVDTRRQRNALGVFAFSLTSLSVGDIERRGLIETDQPEGTFGASDLAYTLAYGRAFSEEWSAGVAGKLIDQEIDSVGARAFALDAGVLRRRGRLSAGGGVRNLGGKVRFRSEADPLPFMFYAGAGFRPGPRWLAAVEIRVPRDDAVRLGLGTEYRKRFGEVLSGSVRGGYNASNTDADGFDGVTFGAGVGYGRLDFDFAWIPFGELGNTFRYCVLVRF
ncbi:MAG: PorV/PorQ family protein [Elusimicrobiota bacterium]